MFKHSNPLFKIIVFLSLNSLNSVQRFRKNLNELSFVLLQDKHKYQNKCFTN